MSFNPLIVGAYSVTGRASVVTGGDDGRFQSPDCRGVFRHQPNRSGIPAVPAMFQSPDCRGVFRHASRARPPRADLREGFNPLIVGAYSVTVVYSARASPAVAGGFQSPDCRGVFRHGSPDRRGRRRSRPSFQSPDCRGVFRHPPSGTASHCRSGGEVSIP